MEDLLADKDVFSVSPNCFISKPSSVSSTLSAGKQKLCCLVLSGHKARYQHNIPKIIQEEMNSCIDPLHGEKCAVYTNYANILKVCGKNQNGMGGPSIHFTGNRFCFQSYMH